MRIILLSICIIMLTSCASQYNHRQANHSAGYLSESEPPTLTKSLFASDQAVLSDNVIEKILSSKLVLPKSARVAILQLDGSNTLARRHYGYQYWRTEEYLKTQQRYIKLITDRLIKTVPVDEALLIPTILIPNKLSVPLLRETAVRLQSDMTLVFNVTSNTYLKSKFFVMDEIKAFSTCEAVLLDVRTGIIAFSTITTEEIIIKEQEDDSGVSETRKRAEEAATLKALTSMTQEMAEYLDSKH